MGKRKTVPENINEDSEIMFGVMPEEESTVELTEHRAMICLPEDSVEVEINAKVFHEGKLISVTKKMTMSDLREAFRKADDGYIDDDDRFVLTEKGKAFFDELEGR